MSNRFYFQLSALVSNGVMKSIFHLACVFVLLVGLATSGRAQNSPGRFEAGGSFTVIQPSGAGGGPFGPGIEGDVNFGRHIAFDATLNWLPERFSLASGGRIVQALVGAKVGTRFQHFGFFAKVRPGFITTGSALRRVTFDPNQFIFTQRFARLTERALDLGGVVSTTQQNIGRCAMTPGIPCFLKSFQRLTIPCGISEPTEAIISNSAPVCAIGFELQICRSLTLSGHIEEHRGRNDQRENHGDQNAADHGNGQRLQHL